MDYELQKTKLRLEKNQITVNPDHWLTVRASQLIYALWYPSPVLCCGKILKTHAEVPL